MGVLAVVYVQPGVGVRLDVHLEHVERDDVTRLRAERLQQNTDVDRRRRKKVVLRCTTLTVFRRTSEAFPVENKHWQCILNPQFQ